MTESPVKQSLRLARRAAAIPPSPIRRLAPLAAARAAEGIKILHVNIGQPDLPAPRAILKAIHPPADGIVPYAPSGGLPATVKAWCEYYAQVGIDVTPDDVVVTTGGGEAIGFAMVAVADPDDEILLFDPTYASYLGYAAASNITLVPVPSEAPAYRLPPREVIERSISPRTRAIVLINPGNPTGTVYTRDELQTVMDIAADNGLFVISDETYRELVFDGREHVSAMNFPGMEDSVILVDSVSKRFSATGLRVGSIVSKNRELMRAVLCMAMARLSSPTVEQQAAIPLLKDPLPYTTWLQATYQSRRDVAYDALRQLPGVSVARPEGAFYVMASLPVDDANAFAQWLITDFECNSETVMVAPGPGFYVTPGLGTQEVRLAYVLGEERLERAVELLGLALERYPGSALS